MSNYEKINEAIDILGNDTTLIHTSISDHLQDVNLKAMLTIRDKLGVKIGYSDHTLGIEVPIAAVTMGATIIEKHFTIDRALAGPDHLASLEPDELKEMIHSIRNIEKAIGDGVKEPSPSEIKNISIARKSILAKRPIKKGELFSENNLTVKRPGTGVSPMEWENIIGKNSDRNYEADDFIINVI